MKGIRMTYDKRHGGPHDRGAADFWYNRPFSPHFYEGATYDTERVALVEMTPADITAYTVGYRDAEEDGTQKDWG